MRRGWLAMAASALVLTGAASRAGARDQPEPVAQTSAAETGAVDDSPPLPAGSPQAFVAGFLRALTVDPTEAALAHLAPDLIDEFLRANGTVVNETNRRIVVRNVMAAAGALVPVERYSVAPKLTGTTDAGHEIVEVAVQSSLTISEADIDRRKRAAADPELRWALGPATAERVATMSDAERDEYFDAQLGTTIRSSAPVRFIVSSAGDSSYRVADVVFGDGDVSLSRLPELVRAARGGKKEIERKRSLATARAIMFAVGALIVMLSLRRYRQAQADKRRQQRRRPPRT